LVDQRSFCPLCLPIQVALIGVENRIVQEFVQDSVEFERRSCLASSKSHAIAGPEILFGGHLTLNHALEFESDALNDWA
jgi:hypothetical protein